MIGFGALMISRQRGLSGLGFCLSWGRRVLHGFRTGVLPAVLALLVSRHSEVQDEHSRWKQTASIVIARAA